MNLSRLARRMINTILIISLICILGSVVYYRSMASIPFVLGVLVGSAVSIVKVFLLERTVDKAITMDIGKAGGYVSLQHVMRLLFSGAALYLGAVVPQISLWGVVAGILAFQLAVYNIRFF